MLRNSNEELQSVRDYYEEKMQDLCNQLNLKVNHIQQMLMEIDEKSKQLEHQKKNEEELTESFFEEN